MAFLEKIKTSADLKKLNISETKQLAQEIRERIIDVVSKNGGHLASNLGVVELTLALHRVFDLPEDSIIFDVGHQCYVHKILTGRNDRFDTLRKQDGISGFTNRAESEYDVFGAGHSGTSVSAALGIAAANKLNNKNAYSIAVVGDGSLTNGMIYEALNNCSSDTPNVIIVLNDNEMSISKNVGAMSSYLSEFSNSMGYIRFKNRVYAFCLKTKWFGKFVLSLGRLIKNAAKKLLMNKNYFECLGLKYFGPIDGHDQQLLELVFEQAKKKNRPSIVHIVTRKGKGYAPAEQRADSFHSVGPFEKESGKTAGSKYDYSAAFGNALCEIAEKDEKVVAITAAMGQGTGLSSFSEKYPKRFFDVGIAEEHAVTFCAGLAAKGQKPVFAVYSSFLQRCYDQIIHDVAIQNLPVIFAVDRAGLVGGDGKTHQGIYDSAFMLNVPGMEVYTPESYSDLKDSLVFAVNSGKCCAVRYPKGTEIEYDRSAFEKDGNIFVADVGNGENKYALVTYGKVTHNVYQAAKNISSELGCRVRVIKLTCIKPMPTEQILAKCQGFEKLIFVEEGIKQGGAGEHLSSEFALQNKKMTVHAIDPQENFSGNADELYEKFFFSIEKLTELIKGI
ncbi:MAG: 1-deoxy-D-xylulose-5-phosphate synthase [Clostridia bacterium]|nr:1-deoxy-D-xylulose-5-phosphate synthase [Clostridia bacterium]